MNKKRRIVIAAVCIVYIFAMVFSFEANNSKDESYRIIIKATCIDNDSVGNEWTKTFMMDGEEISSGHRVTVPNGEVVRKTIKVTITERDTYPDTAETEITFLLREKEEAVKTVTVREDNGRYKGNTAKWKIQVSVK